MLCLIFLAIMFISTVESTGYIMGRRGNRQIIFEKFDSYCGNPEPPILFNYTGVRGEGSRLLMNSSFTVREDIMKDPKLMISIERCRNKENLDTCEPFHIYRASSYCATTATFANDFVKSFKPEWKCPLKKGVYRADNADIDATAFFVFPIETWYWKVVVHIIDKDTEKILLCIIAETHLKRMS